MKSTPPNFMSTYDMILFGNKIFAGVISKDA